MNRPLLLFAALGLAASLAQAQTHPLYVTPDVPTVPGAPATLLSCTGGPRMLPWEIYRYDPTAVVTYTCVLSVPGTPHIDAVHKLDSPGDFLFSVEEPSNLGGVLLPAASRAMPRDLIHYDFSTGTYQLCFVGGSVGIPLTSNVDAMYRTGGDTGDVVISFDVPTTIGAFPTFDPSDLVRVLPSAAAVCPPAWALAAANPIFDASAVGIPNSRNMIGADSATGLLLMSLDVPTNVAPPAQPTRVPGQIVGFAGGIFGLFESLIGWPISSGVDGLSCLANPGTVPTTITLGKTGILDTSPIVINWSPSCSPEGATDYGIYEGKLGSWYSHKSIDCNDAGGDLTETVAPTASDRYYLVVAHNSKEEGSYGTNSIAAERPVGAGACASPQIVTPCPP